MDNEVLNLLDVMGGISGISGISDKERAFLNLKRRLSFLISGTVTWASVELFDSVFVTSRRPCFDKMTWVR